MQVLFSWFLWFIFCLSSGQVLAQESCLGLFKTAIMEYHRNPAEGFDPTRSIEVFRINQERINRERMDQEQSDKTSKLASFKTETLERLRQNSNTF